MSENRHIEELAGKRVLVAGGGGFIGSRLLERMLQRGVHAAALDCSPGRLVDVSTEAQSVFRECDLRDAGQTQRCLARFDPEVVVHLASFPDGSETFEQATQSIDVTLRSTVHLLEAFRNVSNPTLFVYGDSCKVYGNCEVPYRAETPAKPLSSYAIAKAAGWEFCELYRRVHGVPSVAVRPTIIYGPGQGFNLITYVVNCVLDGKSEVALSGGGQTRDPLYIDDALEAYLAVARHGRSLAGRILNISGGAEYTVQALAEQILGLMDSDIPAVAMECDRRPTETQRSFGDNAEARAWLGWSPAVDLDEGLRRTIAHLVAQREAAASQMAG